MRDSLVVLAVMAVITFASRLLPFVLFSRTRPPRWVATVETVLPPLVLWLARLLLAQQCRVAHNALRDTGTCRRGDDCPRPPVEAQRPPQHLLGNGSLHDPDAAAGVVLCAGR